MREITLVELWAKRETLENDAASVLDHMLFEFSRLDVNLGLCLVWETVVHALGSLQNRRAYETWIGQANTVRQQRNNLVHRR